jgi:phospholipid-binding lipoprotein MlaA
MTRSWKLLAALTLASALSACATGTAPKDPLENFNRKVFAFNDKLDEVAIKPAAQVYRKHLPGFVQTGVSNFFGNLGDAWSGVNNLLQGNGADGMSDLMRFAFNSTFGLGGLLDIGSEAGLDKHNEDFGQTLGAWGVKPGPYVVLPVLGPSTFRDTVATPLDLAADPWNYKKPVGVRNAGTVLHIVDVRAGALDASRMIEEAALDKYEFVRDAYLQRRETLVKSGKTDAEDDAEEKAAAPAQEPGKALEPVPKNLDKDKPQGAKAAEAAASAAPAEQNKPATTDKAPAAPAEKASQAAPAQADGQPVKK